jgi:hypothetical protein
MSNSQLRAIHTAARAKGLIDGNDRSAYEQMLWTVARVHSAKDLDSHGRARVLDHLNSGARKTRPRFFAKGTPGALMLVIWSRLAAAHVISDGTESALRSWAKTYVEKELEFCARTQINRLIEQLKRWADERGVAWRQ